MRGCCGPGRAELRTAPVAEPPSGDPAVITPASTRKAPALMRPVPHGHAVTFGHGARAGPQRALRPRLRSPLRERSGGRSRLSPHRVWLPITSPRAAGARVQRLDGLLRPTGWSPYRTLPGVWDAPSRSVWSRLSGMVTSAVVGRLSIGYIPGAHGAREVRAGRKITPMVRHHRSRRRSLRPTTGRTTAQRKKPGISVIISVITSIARSLLTAGLAAVVDHVLRR